MSSPPQSPPPPQHALPFYRIGASLRPPRAPPGYDIAESAIRKLAPPSRASTLLSATYDDYAADMTAILSPPAADIIQNALAVSLPPSDERRDRLNAVARTMIETALCRARAARAHVTLGSPVARRDLVCWRTEARAEAGLYDLHAAAGRADDAAAAAARALALLRARARPPAAAADESREERALAGAAADDALRADLCTAVAVRTMAGEGTPRERAARALPLLVESLALRRGRAGTGVGAGTGVVLGDGKVEGAVAAVGEGAGAVGGGNALGAGGEVSGDAELHGWMVTMRLLADARADLGDLVGAYESCASLLRYLGGRRLAWAAGRRFADSFESMSDSDEEEAVMRKRNRRDRRRDRRRLAAQEAAANTTAAGADDNGAGGTDGLAVNVAALAALQAAGAPAEIVLGGASTMSSSGSNSDAASVHTGNGGSADGSESDNSDGSTSSHVSTESKRRLVLQEREVQLRGWREAKVRRHRSQIQYRMALLALNFNMYGLQAHSCDDARACFCSEMTPDKALALLEASCETVSVRANPQMCWSSVEAVKALVQFVNGMRLNDASVVQNCISMLEAAQKSYPRAWRDDAFGVAEIRCAINRAQRLLARIQHANTTTPTALRTTAPSAANK